MFATVYLPRFPLQALLRATPEMYPRPIAVTEENKILDATPAATREGVRTGHTITQALARCATLQLRLRSPEQEQSTQDALLQCVYGFAANIESTAPGVCTVDLSTQRSKDYAKLCEAIRKQLVALHLHARTGVASTPDLALLAARHARPYLNAEQDKSFAPSLPVHALDLTERWLDILRKWGIETAGQFLALPRNELVERLGPEVGAIWDRAGGHHCRMLKYVLPPERFEEFCEFEHQVETLDPLLFMLRRFLDQICSRLTSAYRVTNAIHLRLQFADDSVFTREFKIPAPSRDPDVLFRILHSRLEGFRADAPIVALCISAAPCLAGNEQFELFESALKDPNSFYETIARLCALAGQENVGIPAPADSHKPDAFHLLPVEASRENSSKPTSNRKKPVTVASRGPALRRLRPAPRAEVTLVQGRPVSIACAIVRQPLHDASGPYPISGQWWDDGAWKREEWDVQAADNTLYRIGRDAEGWFIEGIYD